MQGLLLEPIQVQTAKPLCSWHFFSDDEEGAMSSRATSRASMRLSAKPGA